MDNMKPVPAVPPPAGPTKPPKPPSVMLLGNVGGGKTYSISTLLECGLEVFVLITEANGLDTLLDAVNSKKLDISKLHWSYIPPQAMDWKAMQVVALQINNKTYEELSKTSPESFSRDSCKQYFKLLQACANFHDDRTGQDFGDITTWGDDRALVVDSLSGLNDIVRTAHLGHKPNPHQGEWGTIMNVELNLIKTWCAELQCFFVMIAHVDREKDEISGGTTLTTAALGSKNAQPIARLFSEIVFTRRLSPTGEAVWSTADPAMTLKNRGLAFSSTLKPSFKDLFAVHQRRLEQAKQQKELPV